VTHPVVDPISVEPAVAIDRPVMLQEWKTLTYLHWAYDPAVVQALLPPGLQIDTLDGTAWVGLIPFAMERIRLRRGPAVPHFGTFPEVNVRTYVVDANGRRNIWFFSLDINRLAPTIVARTRYGLPYCWGRGSVGRTGDRVDARIRRFWPRGGGRIEARIDVGTTIEPVAVTELDHFLSARWGMNTWRSGSLWYGQVEHPRWPLRRATVGHLEQDLVARAGLPDPEGPPHVRFSEGVTVRIGSLVRADRPGDHR